MCHYMQDLIRELRSVGDCIYSDLKARSVDIIFGSCF